MTLNSDFMRERSRFAIELVEVNLLATVKSRVVGCHALARIDKVVNRDAHDAHVLDPDGLLRFYDVNVSQGVVHALGRGHFERVAFM